MRAAGTPDFPQAHEAVVSALNDAWDDLCSRRARLNGKDRELLRVAALLRQTHPLVEAAVILVAVPPGPLLLIPCALFAGLLPYGRDRNWGLFSTLLTPLVVLLIDLLSRGGWALALDRLIDTLLGCAIVLLVGYAPWPSSWHAHLPQQFVKVLDSVARYTGHAPRGDPERSALRRQAYRALSDLRMEFQRTMAEPPQ